MNERSGRAPARAETHWPAPAKLNLFLHVVGRRPDGYHRLQTLFQLLDLADTVSITLREDGRIERAAAAYGVPPEEDLAVRAARALQSATGARGGASLRVTKRIPLGGGLGGGSSDAATVLVALNTLWSCGLSLDELALLGLPLGADVPVFVQGSSAWAEGVGEQLTPVELPEAWYVIIHPGVAVATREVFQSPELTRNSPLLTIRAFFESGGRNDCEPVVRASFRRSPRHWSGWGGLPRHGSPEPGPVFSRPAPRPSTRSAWRPACPDRWTSYVARGLNSSPLHEQLAAARGG